MRLGTGRFPLFFMRINGKQIRTVALKDSKVELINQNKLPFEIEILQLETLDEIVYAIETMQVRGAPAIGATGAFGLALSLLNSSPAEWKRNLEVAYRRLMKSRPTAVDLRNCLDETMESVSEVNSYEDAKQIVFATSQLIADRNVDACRKIGEFGGSLITEGSVVLTHCNAGALATVDYGTALAPMRKAHDMGVRFSVLVDETRPRLQGARLTVFELHQEGIPYHLIADNAAGYYMQKGTVSLVITGADRIAVNGDTANKIGTYTKAVLAKENGIPFYIAAPATTFDLHMKTGKEIPVEERDISEVTNLNGKPITVENANALNPAFDVTPAEYITGYITEFGIFTIETISELFALMKKK
jgi:S-methyl-5-thioribose-1-phosphate isomerase